MEPGAIEEHLKQVEESLEEAREEEHAQSKWLSYISLSTAIIAIVTALAGLYESQVTANTILLKNEAVLYQAQASDQWSFYQSKSVKGHIFAVNAELYPAKAEEFTAKADKYKQEQENIKADAKRLEGLRDEKSEESEHYFHKHHVLSFAITFLQISIAIASISALTRNKKFWMGSIGLSVIGCIIALYSLLN
jgi:DNA repair exonuclease SbcCD ATPase subunit